MLKTMIDLSRMQPHSNKLEACNALLANLSQVSFIELFEDKGLLLYDFAHQAYSVTLKANFVVIITPLRSFFTMI